MATNDDLKRMRQQLMEDCRQQYDRTGNPLVVWQAFGVCRQLQQPGEPTVLPEWVLQYFDRVCTDLARVDRARVPIEIDDDAKDATSKTSWQTDVLTAFGFLTGAAGPSDPFRALSRAEWFVELATHVRVYVDGDGLNETDAVHCVATQMDDSIATVWRAWRKHKNEVRARDLETQRLGTQNFMRELDELREFHKPRSR